MLSEAGEHLRSKAQPTYPINYIYCCYARSFYTPWMGVVGMTYTCEQIFLNPLLYWLRKAFFCSPCNKPLPPSLSRSTTPKGDFSSHCKFLRNISYLL